MARGLVYGLIGTLFLAFGGLGAGTWVDEIVFHLVDTVEDAIQGVHTGDFDLAGLPAELAHLTQLDLGTTAFDVSYRSLVELVVNYAGPFFTDGRFNPFYIPEIRHAVSQLVDRNYINEILLLGEGIPIFTLRCPGFPPHEELADVCAAIAADHESNTSEAKDAIDAAMEAAGVDKTEGRYTFRDEPVVVIVWIRSDDERLAVGEYVADILSEIGFTVEREYFSRREAGQTWATPDPHDGSWSVATSGWGNGGPRRTRAADRFFSFVYSDRIRTMGLFEGLSVFAERGPYMIPGLSEVCERLFEHDFEVVGEWFGTLEEAQRLAIDDSSHIWLYTAPLFWLHRSDLAVALDSSIFAFTPLWVRTLRFVDEAGDPIAGGAVRVAVSSTALTSPWSPLDGPYGSDLILLATEEPPTIQHPVTGLHYPNWLEQAEVVAETGTPMRATLDWVKLSFQAEIQVPADALANWDSSTSRFVTASERFDGPVKARTKTSLYFTSDLFDNAWHDGSSLSLGDLLTAFIVGMGRQTLGRPLYDAPFATLHETWLEDLRGLVVRSREPLVVDIYSDAWEMDAENLAAEIARIIWPNYDFGQAPWHTLQLGFLAEAAGAGTLERSESSDEEPDWLSFLAPPGLHVLADQLSWARYAAPIPFRSVLQEYIAPEEAIERYQNLARFLELYGHMWLGLGPMFISTADAAGGSIVTNRFEAFRGSATSWLWLDDE